MVAAFMGTGGTPQVNAANASVGVEDDLSGLGRGGAGRGGRNNAKREGGGAFKVARQFLKGLFGGGGGGGLGGAFGGGGTDSTVATESNVAAMAGQGATSGLPTCADDGTIQMVFHQVSSSVIGNKNE
jgi:hypothetical protein